MLLAGKIGLQILEQKEDVFPMVFFSTETTPKLVFLLFNRTKPIYDTKLELFMSDKPRSTYDMCSVAVYVKPIIA
jgi:hypothetical protein